MFRKISICIAMLLWASVSWSQGSDAPFELVSPKSMQSFFDQSAVHIEWTTDLGEGYRYSIAFSRDGKTFDIPVAVGLTGLSYDWNISAPPGSEGWLKVKMMDYNGMPLADQVVHINWLPGSAIVVSKATQRVYRFKNGELKYTLTCSTALPEFDGIEGKYKVYSKQVKHWSKLYEVWMPHSLFFHRGYALHATKLVRYLGRAASHGCVRLRPKDAEMLFEDTKIGDTVLVLSKKTDLSYLEKLSEPSKQLAGN